MKKRLQKYTVEGRGYFPIEMLFVEGAFPALLEDARNVRRFTLEPRRVQLQRWVSWRDQKHLTRRWESHGWQVIESQTN